MLTRPLPLLSTALATILATSLGAALPAAAQETVVDVTAIVDHPALDAVREGVKEALAGAGYVEGENLELNFQSAQGNVSTAAQIARKFVGDQPDVIVPISTPSAQAVVALTRDVPVVYSAVSDPVAAKLVPDWGPSDSNVTGVSDMVPAAEQLALIGKVAPQVKRSGIIYNPGEANSVAFVDQLAAAVEKSGTYELIEAPAPRTVDVSTSAKSLVGKADLIFAPTDNTVASALPGIAKVASDAQIPLFGGDAEHVKQGAAFGLAVDYAEIGRQTGDVVVRILKGEAPGSIASETSKTLAVYVNPTAAAKQGLTIPADVAATATTVE